MLMIWGGLATMVIFAPLAAASDPLLGWWTFGTGIGGYAELFSR